MNYDDLKRTGDQLMEQVGGYNLRSVVIIGVGGLALGYLSGGVARSLFGPYYLLLPLIAGLLAVLVAVLAAGIISARSSSSVGGGADSRDSAPPVKRHRVSPDAPPPVRTRPKPTQEEFSELESRIMKRIAEKGGDLSVSAIAEEAGVSGDAVRKAVEDLAARGLLALPAPPDRS